MSEGATPDVQPEGQGEGDNSFVADYLNNVPEDYRPHVEPYVKQIESNANSKFAEHAEYRKQWEPFEELGLQDYEPESLQQLLQFAELASDPEQFKTWWQNAGQELGLFDTDDDDAGNFDDDDEGLDPQELEELFDQVIEQRMQPFLEEKQQREYNDQVQQATEAVEEQLAGFEEEHGELSEDDRTAILKFAYTYAEDDPDPITKGFEDWQRLVNGVETSTVQSKADTPTPPERPGRANTAPEQIKDYEGAKAAAMERLKQSHSV